MSNLIKRTLIYTAIIITVFSISWYLFYIHDPYPLGNTLAKYFYDINGVSVVEYDVNELFMVDVENVTGFKLKKFCKEIDWSLKGSPIAYQSDGSSSWNQLNRDGSAKENYLNYWQATRTLANKFYADNIDKMYINDPVIHFRCSDIPFIKHRQYHMTKAASVRWMADQVKSRGYDKVILLSCNSHHGLDSDSCAKYIDFYTGLLEQSGIAVTRQCKSIYYDFATMVNSPLLVSLNSSSYSFMAGIAKDPANYISCNMGIEVEGVYYLQTEADWVLDVNPPLLHKDVSSYHDVTDVIRKLEY